MKEIVRLFLAAFITFIVLKSTTFGWKSFFTSTKSMRPQDRLLVTRIKQHVYKLSQEIGDRNVFNYANLEKAKNYIVEQFAAAGYKVKFQEYLLENKKVENVIAIKKGTKLPEEIIIVGAHYDSCFNPGADDNASGIAGLLELARLMTQDHTDRTIEFIAFTSEEPPFFKTEKMGSRIYARAAKAVNKNIKAVVIFDLIGFYSNKIFSQRYPIIVGLLFPNKGNFIGVFGNFKSRWLVSQVSKIFRDNSSFPLVSLSLDFIPGIDFSDHWSFWKEGYPAIMVSDTAFFRHRNYHKNTDTWEKLNYEKIACVTEGFYYVLSALAK